jgi:hypothetical protein
MNTFLDVNVGAPQGSTLGPFLFLLFINDIENEVLNNIKMFADDTSIKPECQTRSNALEMSQNINRTSLPRSIFFIIVHVLYMCNLPK